MLLTLVRSSPANVYTALRAGTRQYVTKPEKNRYTSSPSIIYILTSAIIHLLVRLSTRSFHSLILESVAALCHIS